MKKRFPLRFLATCPRGAEKLLLSELKELGLSGLHLARGGVRFDGELAHGFRAGLWSRLAHRVLLHLRRFPAVGADDLYSGVQTFDWDDVLTEHTTFAVHTLGTTQSLRHTHFTSLKVKDAIVDQIRARRGVRPSVDRNDPVVRVVVHLDRGHCAISLDLIGVSLHRRGYRVREGDAPLRETLAATLVRWSNWDRGEPYIDPMCGSGTLVIEAAMLAMDRAPGRGLMPAATRWPLFTDADLLWAELCEEADARAKAICPAMIWASDRDRRALAACRANLRAAGIEEAVTLIEGEATDLSLPQGPGLILANPPYGERMMGDGRAATILRAFGDTLESHLGFRAVIFSGHPEMESHIPAEAIRRIRLFNGPIPCQALEFAAPGSKASGKRRGGGSRSR